MQEHKILRELILNLDQTEAMYGIREKKCNIPPEQSLARVEWTVCIPTMPLITLGVEWKAAFQFRTTHGKQLIPRCTHSKLPAVVPAVPPVPADCTPLCFLFLRLPSLILPLHLQLKKPGKRQLVKNQVSRIAGVASSIYCMKQQIWSKEHIPTCGYLYCIACVLSCCANVFALFFGGRILACATVGGNISAAEKTVVGPHHKLEISSRTICEFKTISRTLRQCG